MDILSYTPYISALEQVGFLPILFGTYLFSMGLFWYESRMSNKDRNSLFDMWFFTTILMLLWGRITYVMTNWDQFRESYWFWLPYEKYGDVIYIFRAMPWKIFRLWDGGFLFIPMFLAFIILGYIYAVAIKRWRWKDMMTPVLLTATTMLGFTLHFYGIFVLSNLIATYGLMLIILVTLYSVLIWFVRKIFRYKPEPRANINNLITLLYSLANLILVSYIFLSQEITAVDSVHVYGFIIFYLFIVVVYFYDRSRPEKEQEVELTPVRKHNIYLNQAIKIRE